MLDKSVHCHVLLPFLPVYSFPPATVGQHTSLAHVSCIVMQWGYISGMTVTVEKLTLQPQL